MNSCVLSLLCLYTDEILAGIMMEGLEAVLLKWMINTFREMSR